MKESFAKKCQSESPASGVSLPSSKILTAALAGLMGGSLGGCGQKEKEKIVEVAPPAPSVTKKTEGLTDMTLARFSTDCDARGGLVQLHASCSGVNSCKGMSFSHGTLIEHTCKGVNTCAGMSCVVLPEDGGLTGQEILEGTRNGEPVGSTIQCNFCHGEGKEKFALPIAPDKDEQTETAVFTAKSNAALVSAIAFGLHGTRKTDGTAYSNMPGFHQAYSRAEIERVVTYLRTLPLEVKKWTDPE